MVTLFMCFDKNDTFFVIFKLCDLNKARFDQIKKILSLIFELLSTTFIQTSEHSKINKIIRDFFYKTMLFNLTIFKLCSLMEFRNINYHARISCLKNGKTKNKVFKKLVLNKS